MMPTAIRPAQSAEIPTEQARASVEEGKEESFGEILREEAEETTEAVEVAPDLAQVDLPMIPFVQLLEGEPDGDPIATAEVPSVKLEAKLAPQTVEVAETEVAEEAPAPEVEVEAAPFELPLQETSTPVDSQVTLRGETKNEPAVKVMPQIQLEPAFEPAFEEPIRMARMTAESAELVLGQGEKRVQLTVSTEGHRVHVAALAASVEVVQALTRTSGELRDALSRQGYELGGFDMRRDRSSHDGEQREPAHSERQQMVVKKKRIVA